MHSHGTRSSNATHPPAAEAGLARHRLVDIQAAAAAKQAAIDSERARKTAASDAKAATSVRKKDEVARLHREREAQDHREMEDFST